MTMKTVLTTLLGVAATLAQFDLVTANPARAPSLTGSINDVFVRDPLLGKSDPSGFIESTDFAAKRALRTNDESQQLTKKTKAEIHRALDLAAGSAPSALQERGTRFSGLARRANNGTVDACPGYKATNVKTSGNTLSATLTLAGTACNVYGPDLQSLKLQVTYETTDRIHVKIGDTAGTRYEVPESVLPRPSASKPAISPSSAAIQFKYTTSPFTFSIVRPKTGEVLFGTSAQYPLIFEQQYLRLKTGALPADANIYGLGEHTETFRLPNDNFTRTLWSRDAYSVPPGTNLYGNHPVYYEHRTTGTHGVFLVNSNGMDIKINQENGHTTLEYNVIGGILDLYFIAGPSPVQVAQQYSEIVGTPAEVGYWALGFHQCRYGYTDYLDVAEVVQNYSRAGIPLETMWTDIDFYYQRWTFTNDPQYFPLNEMQLLISDLHARGQHYILMVDPAVAYQPGENYLAYDQGVSKDVFLKNPGNNQNFSDYFVSVVWPGMTVFPDWFHPDAASYWNEQFLRFFDATTGVDVDGAWIDMNDPATFCAYPCTDPAGQAVIQGLPPNRTTSPPPANATFSLSKRDISRTAELVARADNSTIDYLNPPYAIDIATPTLSDRTAYTDIKHANGLMEYDTHNLYGTMMSMATRDALLARRPGQRPLVITRSTFAGAGHSVGKWLGDNISDDYHYLNSISGILNFASIFQLPVVGADVCGFGGNTTPELCARWATLGSFYPFFRNHNELGGIDQEFYRWPIVAAAAKNGINTRYRLLDYLYTAIHQASLDGTPVLNPYWYLYPSDTNTFAIDSQFFFGNSILVSPVTTGNGTSVDAYFAKDRFYDWYTYAPVNGAGSVVTYSNVNLTDIKVHIKGGAVLPLRATWANTTEVLREQPFELVVAPNTAGTASGQLYVDDGISIKQTKPTTLAKFTFAKGVLAATGTFKATPAGKVSLVSFLGVTKAPSVVLAGAKVVEKSAIHFDAANSVLRVNVSIPLTAPFTVLYK
ncbi:hypothetical protein DL93DRAFT_2124857 [Clavulina sp. PMI_390]|nr:hypothetical protein DL93DRAFT_2124857 [Clavulina sp. PMI_390]